MAINNEKLLSALLALADRLPDDDRKKFQYFTSDESDKLYIPDTIPGILADIVLGVEEDMRTAKARAGGVADIRKAALAVISDEASRRKDSGAFMHGGRLCVLDGYRLIRFSANLDALDLPMRASAPPINPDDVVMPHEYTQPIDCPSLPEIKAHMQIQRAKAKAAGVKPKDMAARGYLSYDFGEGLPMVNARYLLEMLQALPNCTVSINPRSGSLSMLYFSADNGDGVILPIRKNVSRKPA